MAWRMGLGPVFGLELRAAVRQRRVYLGRVAFLVALLTIPAVGVWMNSELPRNGVADLGHAMRVFARFSYAVLATIQLTLVLLVAPAAATDAFGRARPRGPLAHLLVTDLSPSEIVFGTVAARLVPVLMLLLSVVPLVLFEVVCFGTDPESMMTLTAVSLGLAVLGVAVSAAFSLWARRAYDVLLGVYLLWIAWLLSPAVWAALITSPPPRWLARFSPYAATQRLWDFGMVVVRPTPELLPVLDSALFLAFAWMAALFILALTALRLRSAALSEVRPRRRRSDGARPGVFGRLRAKRQELLRRLPSPSLDGNPVLWREWSFARRSRWLRAYWVLYTIILGGATAVSLLEEASGNISHSLIPCAAFGTGFGLLAVAVHAASAWSVEREAGQGGLDVLLSTPLSAAEFVRGKWWACFRPVLGVAVVPALAAVLMASWAPTLPSVPAGATLPVAPVPLRAFDRVSAAVVVIGQPFAYGALVVSFGLWLATRCARPTRAVVTAMVGYGVVAVVWPIVEEVFIMRVIDRNLFEGLAAVSPMAAATVTLMSMFNPWYGTARRVVPYAAGWLVVAVAIAAGLRWLTVRNFDRWMGRMGADVIRAGNGDIVHRRKAVVGLLPANRKKLLKSE